MVPPHTDLTFFKLGRRRRWCRVWHSSLEKVDQRIVQSGNLMFHRHLSHSFFLLLFERLEWSLSKLT
jgi:hypothetical protein